MNLLLRAMLSLGCLLTLLVFLGGVPSMRAVPQVAEPKCPTLGWFPDAFGLKDHAVFRYEHAFYIAATYYQLPLGEDRFVYGRSTDLCTWEDLGPILTERLPGAWDEKAVWAPFVWVEDGVYYLYYTGVMRTFTQSIMLATSTNPADPNSWQVQGVVLQPNHVDAVWPGAGFWSDARDPYVLKVGSRYYLYYTGSDRQGGIVGVATADNPSGPWQDWGAITTTAVGMLESPGVIERNGWYYLYYNPTGQQAEPEFRIGPTPSGPWSAPRPLRQGWAHEFWQQPDGSWMTSYLTHYAVTIKPVVWDDTVQPHAPWIEQRLWHLWLPLIAVE